MEGQGTQATLCSYRLTVDRARSLDELINAGHYDLVCHPPVMAEHFPVEGVPVTVDALLVDFNRDISTKRALTELVRLGLRPGTFAELLAFGAEYPEMQRQFPIVELGSVWTRRDGSGFVACLWGSARVRDLHTIDVEGDWDDVYRFLAFPRS